MLFISRYKNYRLGLRATVKEHVHTSSGGQDVIPHKGVVVQFINAVYDTKNWEEHTRPGSPSYINTIKSESDLIELMKKSEYYGTDFFERVIETRETKRAKLLEELARLEAEDSADDPDNAPEHKEDTGTPDVIGVQVAASKAKAKGKKASSKAKTKAKGSKRNSSSVVEI